MFLHLPPFLDLFVSDEVVLLPLLSASSLVLLAVVLCLLPATSCSSCPAWRLPFPHLLGGRASCGCGLAVPLCFTSWVGPPAPEVGATLSDSDDVRLLQLSDIPSGSSGSYGTVNGPAGWVSALSGGLGGGTLCTMLMSPTGPVLVAGPWSPAPEAGATLGK